MRIRTYILFMAFIGRKLLSLFFSFSELSECLLSSGSDLEDAGYVLTQLQNCCLPEPPDYGSLKERTPACNGARMSCTPCDSSNWDVYPVHLRFYFNEDERNMLGYLLARNASNKTWTASNDKLVSSIFDSVWISSSVPCIVVWYVWMHCIECDNAPANSPYFKLISDISSQ